MTETTKPGPEWTCRKCGECCRHDSPALHTQDVHLVTDGVISPAQLMTLRKGEMVRDQVRDVTAPLEEEIVKLAPQGQGWTCGMLHMIDNLCTIYENRLAECRAMVCEDPASLDGLYDVDRVTRMDIVNPDGPLAELIGTHEEKCSAVTLRELAEASLQGDSGAADAILEMLAFDRAMRDLAREKANIDPGLFPFLFGRPVERLLPGVGLRLDRSGGKLAIKSAPQAA